MTTAPTAEPERAELSVPADLEAALAADCAIEAAWRDITPIARRDFITWIEGAKKAETRARRVAVCCDKLARGDRRPCCVAVVPLDLYTGLNGSPAARAQWKGLTSDERRDWVAWIEEAAHKTERKGRIEQACGRMAVGKRVP